METKASLKVVSTTVKCVLIYLKIEKATLHSLPWNKIAILYLKRNNTLQLRTNNNNNNNNNRIQRRYSRFFYNLLTAPRTVSNTYAKVTRAQSCVNHVQHIKRLSRASVMLCATWYEGTAQLFSLTELKSHLFELYFIG